MKRPRASDYFGMDEEFPTSPSKRRRTESPDAPVVERKPSIPGLGLTETATTGENVNHPAKETAEPNMNVEQEPQAGTVDSGPDLLNILMAQVEAQAEDRGPNGDAGPAVEDLAGWKQQESQQLSTEIQMTDQESQHLQAPIPGISTDDVQRVSTSRATIPGGLMAEQDKIITELDSSITADNHGPCGGVENSLASSLQKPELNDTEQKLDISLPDITPEHHQQADVNAIVSNPGDPPTDPDALVAHPAEREWQTDSSPYSSDSDSSDDSSSEEDSDDEGDNDYALLSPTEQARILMDEAGSDDEGKSKATGGALKTANEKVEQIIPKPDIIVTPEMRIEELGSSEAVVESTVLIKGKTTGEYQVLESGSLLCLKDRSVVGVVADTMGRVEQPLYTVRFTNDEAIAEAGIAEKGTPIYYVHAHSTFVFTQPLKGIKGSDASNFHDEEVGDEEMEFSDDEKEAEHRRLLKLRKRGIDVDSLGSRGGRGGARGGVQGRGGRGGGRGRGRGGFQPGLPMHPENVMVGASDATSLNYDEGEVTEYEPLRRPRTMESQEAPTQNGHRQPERQQQDNLPPRFQHHDTRRNGNHRGRAQNNRGRGNRGNFQQNSYQQQPQQGHGFNQQQQSWMPPVPPPPSMPNFFNPGGMMPGNAGFNFGQQQNGYSNPFGQQSYGQQQPRGYDQAFPQQTGYSLQSLSYGGAWANNQAAAEQVQRQLEELRRQAQQHGGGQSGPHYA